MSDAARQWTQFYTASSDMMYPAEAVIRIFKGSYPKLTMPKPTAGQSILDVGFGDGRHFPLFKSLGMQMAGSEITREIVAETNVKLYEAGLPYIDLRVGTCAALLWDPATFDYVMAWNSCYYMGPDGKIQDHVAEMARVLKPGGWLVCSVPTSDCFIFEGSEHVADDPYGDEGYYAIIRNDYFGLRNGERMRVFGSRSDVEADFISHFTNFSHASIDIDMFGLAYNWHVFTAERRG